MKKETKKILNLILSLLLVIVLMPFNAKRINADQTTDTATVNFYLSTVDGEEFIKTLTIPLGMSLNEYFELEDMGLFDVFADGDLSYSDDLWLIKGYAGVEILLNKPLTNYESFDAIMDNEEYFELESKITENLNIYFVGLKIIEELELTVTLPECGTEVVKNSSIPFGAPGYQLPTPVVTINTVGVEFWEDEDEVHSLYFGSDEEPFAGKLECNKEVMAQTWLRSKFGYIFSVVKENVTINNANELLYVYLPEEDRFVRIDYLMSAAHEYSEWTINNLPSETSPGTATRKCSHCGDIQDANAYQLVFDLDGGTYNGQTGKYILNEVENETFNLPIPTKQGFIFDYWDGSRYEGGQAYKVSENHAFKAIWKQSTPQREVPDTSAR